MPVDGTPILTASTPGARPGITLNFYRIDVDLSSYDGQVPNVSVSTSRAYNRGTVGGFFWEGTASGGANRIPTQYWNDIGFPPPTPPGTQASGPVVGRVISIGLAIHNYVTFIFNRQASAATDHVAFELSPTFRSTLLGLLGVEPTHFVFGSLNAGIGANAVLLYVPPAAGTQWIQRGLPVLTPSSFGHTTANPGDMLPRKTRVPDLIHGFLSALDPGVADVQVRSRWIDSADRGYGSVSRAKQGAWPGMFLSDNYPAGYAYGEVYAGGPMTPANYDLYVQYYSTANTGAAIAPVLAGSFPYVFDYTDGVTDVYKASWPGAAWPSPPIYAATAAHDWGGLQQEGIWLRDFAVPCADGGIVPGWIFRDT